MLTLESVLITTLQGVLITTLHVTSFGHFSLPPEPMDIDHDQSAPLDLPSNQVTVLKGHESEVFTCAWSPSADIIVSG